MNKGFSLIETITALAIVSITVITLIPGMVYLKKNYQQQEVKYLQKCQQLDINMQDLFLPVEDVEWALRTALQ